MIWDHSEKKKGPHFIQWKKCVFWSVGTENNKLLWRQGNIGSQIIDKSTLHQTLSIRLGTQFTQPNPESGPLQGFFET